MNLCCQIHPFYICYKCRIKLCEDCGKKGSIVDVLTSLAFVCENCESAFQTSSHSEYLKDHFARTKIAPHQLYREGYCERI
jgi:hypothetical protein